jgi:SAM-dependent methyltransferase
MGFYDNYNKNRPKITSFGIRLVNYRNNFFIKIIKHYKKNKIKLLEIGPGKGYFAKQCIFHEIDYKGIEGCKSLYLELKKKGLKIYHSTVPPIKIKEKFDIIFMNQVFEHMENNNKAQKLLEGCKSKLNKNGLLIISSPDIIFWKEDFFAGDYTHTKPTSIINVQQILFDNSFKILIKGHYSLWFENFLICSLITSLTRFFYNLGLFYLFFGKRAYKVKTSLLPSCYFVARKEN